MGAKKKKKGKKKKKAKKENDDDEEKVENPIFTMEMQHYGWIRVKFQMCNPIPTKKDWNFFVEVMRSDERVLELKQRITDYHGRVEEIALFNEDPIPKRDSNTGIPKDVHPNIPPYTDI